MREKGTVYGFYTPGYPVLTKNKEREKSPANPVKGMGGVKAETYTSQERSGDQMA